MLGDPGFLLDSLRDGVLRWTQGCAPSHSPSCLQGDLALRRRSAGSRVQGFDQQETGDGRAPGLNVTPCPHKDSAEGLFLTSLQTSCMPRKQSHQGSPVRFPPGSGRSAWVALCSQYHQQRGAVQLGTLIIFTCTDNPHLMCL